MRRLTDGPAYYATPRFTPDGRRILAVRWAPGEQIRLVSLALDGTDEQLVFVSSDPVARIGPFAVANLEYAQSPDGRNLALNDTGTLYSTWLGAGAFVRRHGSLGFVQTRGFTYADELAPRAILSGGENYPGLPLTSVALDGSGKRQTILENQGRNRSGTSTRRGAPPLQGRSTT